MVALALLMAANIAANVCVPSTNSWVEFPATRGVSAIACSIAMWRLRMPASPGSGAIFSSSALLCWTVSGPLAPTISVEPCLGGASSTFGPAAPPARSTQNVKAVHARIICLAFVWWSATGSNERLSYQHHAGGTWPQTQEGTRYLIAPDRNFARGWSLRLAAGGTVDEIRVLAQRSTAQGRRTLCSSRRAIRALCAGEKACQPEQKRLKSQRTVRGNARIDQRSC